MFIISFANKTNALCSFRFLLLLLLLPFSNKQQRRTNVYLYKNSTRIKRSLLLLLDSTTRLIKTLSTARVLGAADCHLSYQQLIIHYEGKDFKGTSNTSWQITAAQIYIYLENIYIYTAQIDNELNRNRFGSNGCLGGGHLRSSQSIPNINEVETDWRTDEYVHHTHLRHRLDAFATRTHTQGKGSIGVRRCAKKTIA